jgi:hypothetical protein
MRNLLDNRPCAVVLAMLLLFLWAFPAVSRPWTRDPATLAQEYSLINDNRGKGDIVIVIWLSPPMIPDGPLAPRARETLDDHIIIGVVHAHASKEAVFTFDAAVAPEVSDGNGKTLKTMTTDEMPPTIVGTLTTVQTIFARALGPLGQGTHWFAFEHGSVHACGKGGMSVRFAGETYTYETPIPGCP